MKLSDLESQWPHLRVDNTREPGPGSNGHAECVHGEASQQLLHEAGFLTRHSWGSGRDSRLVLQ